MRKKLIISIIAALLTISLSLTGCAREYPPIAVKETLAAPTGLRVENRTDLVWDRVTNAEGYIVTLNGSEYRVSTPRFRTSSSDFVTPSDTNIWNASIIAFAEGYNNSVSANITYIVEAGKLTTPVITSLQDNILTWSTENYSGAYKVIVNGEVISNGLHATNTLAVNTYIGELKVEISAVGDVYQSASDSITVYVSADHKKVFRTVKNIAVHDGVLSWDAVSGARGYRLYDINNSVIDVTVPNYDMQHSNIIKRIKILNASDSVYGDDDKAEPINYLEGEGTANSPYLIKSAFDLRAIDYYEQIYYMKAAYGKTEIDDSVAKNCYKIANDINYLDAPFQEEETNLIKLTQAFFGTLDGDGKRLINCNVNYDGGRWALFDTVLEDAVIKNIVFEEIVVENVWRVNDHPLASSTSVVAYNNYGTIDGVKLVDARITASGGAVGGIVMHNRGMVSNCVISGSAFIQKSTGMANQTCYEMACVVSMNYGKIEGNRVQDASHITGSTANGGGGTYNNIRLSAAIASINTENGKMANNYVGAGFGIYHANAGAGEFGALCGFNNGLITYMREDVVGFKLSFAISGTDAFVVSIKNGTVGSGADKVGALVGNQGPTGETTIDTSIGVA